MKSSLCVLCAVVLICFGSVRCGRYYGDEDENFLDKTKIGDEGRTEKEVDIERKLYKARNLWNELTNEISQLYREEEITPDDEDGEVTEVDDTGGEDNGKKDDGDGEDTGGEDNGKKDDGDGEDTGGEDNGKKAICDLACKNGGTCELEGETPTCKCTEKFEGVTCETPICDPACKNGGTCELKEDGTRGCKCTGDFEGDTCEKPKCNPACKNGGTCELKDDGARGCKCTGDFEGDTCEKRKCNLDCKNDGTCELKDNITPYCKCDDGYGGETCEYSACEDVSDCEGENKECKEKLCVCQEGFEGNDCEIVTGCKVLKVKCDEIKAECKFDKDALQKASCSCEDNNDVYDPEENKCKLDNCTAVCGIPFNKPNEDLRCEGGPFGKVKCVCKDVKKDFDDSDKTCRKDYCKEICNNLKCKGNKFDEADVDCECRNKDQDFIKNEKKCKTNYCRKVCGTGDHIVCNGDIYDPKKIAANCSCDDSDYVYKNKRCQKKCSSNDECENGGKCEGGDTKFCKCVPGTEGDNCESIIDCTRGKYRNCKGSNGECKFENGKAVCKCTDDKALYEEGGYCEATCNKDDECGGSNRKCIKNFCLCKDGYEGDECNVITGCKELEENCKKIQTQCVFGTPGKPICECKEGYTYDYKEIECKHPYCYPTNPCKEGKCEEDKTAGIGYCKCPENKYYNYKTEKCQDFQDKCLLRKTPCGENEICNDGKCECKFPNQKEGECKPKLCDPNPCFEKAKCSEEDGSCFCEEGKYYNGKKCEDAKCRLDDYKKNCTCPQKMERKEGEECKPKDKEVDLCSTDCGYGLCVKKGDKEECKCFTFAQLKTGKCILKKSFCVGDLLEGSMKCNCTGKYTQASDGITCRLKTCKDDGVEEECEKRGGECNMDWKTGYYCKCPEGYEQNEHGKCTDPCSISKNIRECASKNMLCYNYFSTSNKRTFNCGCPPTLQYVDGECSKKAENVYLIKNIPVLKKKYERNFGINRVLLNTDLIQSLEQTFASTLFEYGYLYDYRISGDILNCSVWINFKDKPDSKELEKIKLLSKTFSNACEDCDDSAIVWPPNVLLSGTGLNEAKSDSLQFCSDEVKNLLCGKGTTCESNKCSCDDGFKIIDYKEVKNLYTIQRCEDIDECALGIHSCPENTVCRNTLGDYKCVCTEGFKKQKVPDDPETDKTKCFDMCSPSPCKKGKCKIKGKTFDCECSPGAGGSLCDREDENYKSAKKGTVVVGAVLGTILAVGAIAFLYYIIKVRKNSGSEDFMPAARMDHAEMSERRPVRGVVNKAYD